MLTLDEMNTCSTTVLREALFRCCASDCWVEQMIAFRPFTDTPALMATADSCWWALNEGEWLTAFSAHPRIGEKKLSEWCSREQSGLDSASSSLLGQLASANAAYQQKFGWLFLVNATGKTGHQMLAILQSRLQNERDKELHIAAAEQAQITRLRLEKLLQL